MDVGQTHRAPQRQRKMQRGRRAARDETLKVFLQNLLDSMLIAFMWGNSRCWSVHVD
jgi:hypothetical protein